MDFRVGYNYRLGRKIGSGSFGDIYLGTDISTCEEVAIKLEPVDSKSPQLGFEYKVYRQLKGGVGIPSVYYYGVEGNFNVMVMELLGPSLEDLFNYCNRRFSLKTVCMIAQELILRLEYLHSKNYIHRDVKPDNFVIGLGKKANIVHIIDLGLSKRYRNPLTKAHIPYREDKSLTGTPRYASLGNHLGMEQSRRDDLESLGYIFLYFLKGKLPWQGMKAETKKEKYAKIMEKKIEMSMAELCAGQPDEFKVYLEYCRALRFEDCPNYDYLRRLFQDLMKRKQLVDDGIFDWMNESIAHNPSALPRHCIDTNGGLRKDLLRPAPQAYRESLSIADVIKKENVQSSIPAVTSRSDGMMKSENDAKSSPQQRLAGKGTGVETSAGSGRIASVVQPINKPNTGNTQNANAKGSSRMGTFRRLWHIDRNTG
ncbi:hypothetical protein WA538_000744 [Blastocystis sp. DL]